MTTGYSGKPLVRKLGLKENKKILIVNHPGADYENELGPLPSNIELVKKMGKEMDFIHFFTKSSKELKKKLPEFKKSIKPDGMIWVSWPKRASKIKTDIDENIIRETALSLGLVDVKVCAVTEIWSGLKLVIRKENR